MPNERLLWAKMMIGRTRNRVQNIPKFAQGLTFHARLADTGRRGPRFFVQRWGGIGDLICLQPSLAALRAQDPDALIVLCTASDNFPLVRMMDGLDAVLDLKGAPGYRPLTDRLYTQVFVPFYQDEKPTGLPRVHVIDDFARQLGVTLEDRQPRLSVPPDVRERLRPEVEALRRGGGPVIAIQTGPTEAVRMWRPEHWAALARRLETESGASVILLGTDFHYYAGRTGGARVPGVADWMNRFSLPETAAVLSLCDQFVGIDSGLLHMAGAVGTPSVGLFGPVDPALRLPPATPAVGVRPPEAVVPCLGCHHRVPRLHWRMGCPHDIACMREITPDAVFEAAMALPRREVRS